MFLPYFLQPIYAALAVAWFSLQCDVVQECQRRASVDQKSSCTHVILSLSLSTRHLFFLIHIKECDQDPGRTKLSLESEWMHIRQIQAPNTTPLCQAMFFSLLQFGRFISQGAGPGAPPTLVAPVLSELTQN